VKAQKDLETLKLVSSFNSSSSTEEVQYLARSTNIIVK